MSQEPNSHDEGPIQTPQQLILAIVLSFVVPVAIIALLVVYVTSGSKDAAGSSALAPESVAQRIMPVGSVEIKLATAAAGARTGEEVFKAQCASCHAAGALGAPKFGDAAAWAPRIGQGADALYASALNGKNAMPKQGGGDFSDDEIKRAVVHMANAGGAKFEAPAAAAGGAASGAASADAVPALYTATCAACHDAGVMNAPKLGDKTAWAPRLAAGVDGLTASAIKGKNMMPPKGGSAASDDEIKAVVTYMVGKAK